MTEADLIVSSWGRSVHYATLLRVHVTLICRSMDWIFLQAYVLKLQSVGWLCQFLRWQHNYEFLVGGIREDWRGLCADIHRQPLLSRVPRITDEVGGRDLSTLGSPSSTSGLFGRPGTALLLSSGTRGRQGEDLWDTP